MISLPVKKNGHEKKIVTLPGYCCQKRAHLGTSRERTLKSSRNEAENRSMSDFLRTWARRMPCDITCTTPEKDLGNKAK
jgi:hypothetical protein